jgi:predicted MPP superfamily phosphohydrolase
LAVGGRSFHQTGVFRVRRVELSIPQLPPDLDGVTIAHVTDLHIGRFLPPELAGPIADAINALSCDLVAFTGDLIDVSQPDPAPGIDFLHRLHPQHRLVVIEGNHDVMFKAEKFEAEVKSAGLPLLLDEATTIRLPGRATAVQLLGMSWGELLPGSQLHKHGRARDSFFREPSDRARAASIRHLISLRDPDAFPILLGHHPHAFDPAAEAGLPLVLSGHTHGGQLMLTQNIGAGPMRFRYWSGLYRKPNSQLFISNGLGSWFPLRVNAPAEIVHLTLRRETAVPPII